MRHIAQELQGMLRSGTRRSAANDTTLSDRELRKVEVDGVVLEQKLEALRKQQEERADALMEHVSPLSPCSQVQCSQVQSNSKCRVTLSAG